MFNDIRETSKVRAAWESVIDKIPAINFPPEWNVKLIPPVGGAVVRFNIIQEGAKQNVSVYLDCFQNLGYSPEGPYWEIYPYDDDVYRVGISETEELIKAIQYSMKQIKIGESLNV